MFMPIGRHHTVYSREEDIETLVVVFYFGDIYFVTFINKRPCNNNANDKPSGEITRTIICYLSYRFSYEIH